MKYSHIIFNLSFIFFIFNSFFIVCFLQTENTDSSFNIEFDETNELIEDSYSKDILKNLKLNSGSLISDVEILVDYIFQLLSKNEDKEVLEENLGLKTTYRLISEKMALKANLPVKVSELGKYVNNEAFLLAKEELPEYIELNYHFDEILEDFDDEYAGETEYTSQHDL